MHLASENRTVMLTLRRHLFSLIIKGNVWQSRALRDFKKDYDCAFGGLDFAKLLPRNRGLF